jgi:ribosome maturation protein Sdo1
LDAASKASLDNEFGTHVDEDVIKIILEKGTAQEATMPERQGTKNDSQGPMGAH